jgi:hypothetical protein
MGPESETIDTTGTGEEETTPTKPVTTIVQPEEDYEKRFKGLQKLFDRQQKKVAELEEERDSLLEARETLSQGDKQKQAALDKAKVDLDLLNKEKETLSLKLSSQEATAKRTNLILSEFSDLAAFEAQGLLPAAATEEEMREKFTKFRDALGKTIDKNVQDRVQGTGPGPTGPTEPPAGRTKEQIYAELTRLAGSRSPEDRKKYDELVAEWDKLE